MIWLLYKSRDSLPSQGKETFTLSYQMLFHNLKCKSFQAPRLCQLYIADWAGEFTTVSITISQYLCQCSNATTKCHLLFLITFIHLSYFICIKTCILSSICILISAGYLQIQNMHPTLLFYIIEESLY
jgi:hypothetical protein